MVFRSFVNRVGTQTKNFYNNIGSNFKKAHGVFRTFHTHTQRAGRLINHVNEEVQRNDLFDKPAKGTAHKVNEFATLGLQKLGHTDKLLNHVATFSG